MRMRWYFRAGKVQRGASAIFVVVFASLVLSLIAVSFVGLMVREQARSTDDEQSQGAYDAAMAGIEDGKRVLLECTQGSGTQKDAACAAIDPDNQKCTTVIDAGIAGSPDDKEVAVVSSAGSANELNLAYTCVLVSQNTPDYLGTLASSPAGADASVVIPLRATGTFNTVDINWFTEKDATVPQIPSVTTPELPSLTSANWPSSQPPVMRVQMMQFEDDKLSEADFDSGVYAHTVYLYPAQAASTAAIDISAADQRQAGNANPILVLCTSTYTVSGYACHASIALPTGPGITEGGRIAYLRLTGIYNGANYQVKLRNGGAVVKFNDVQSEIDATGRANDLFRRVKVRVEKVATLPYPRATVDITGNLCKTFSVGAAASDYVSGSGSCNPNN